MIFPLVRKTINELNLSTSLQIGYQSTQPNPGGELVDIYDGGDHIHIWGLKFRKEEYIWGRQVNIFGV